MMKIIQIFGSRLKALRKERKINQKDIADKVGIHLSYVGLLERGERIPSLIALYNIASFFGVKPADMIREDDEGQKLSMKQKELLYIINEASKEEINKLYQASKVLIRMGNNP